MHYHVVGFIFLIASIFQHGAHLSEQGDDASSFKIMTYNIHHGEGLDGIVNLERIATVIKNENPDIVLLQEVDVFTERTDKIDIPKKLSEMTDLDHFVFGKNINFEGGEYGLATLSKVPIVTSQNIQYEKRGTEQRGILVTIIEMDPLTFLVLNTHLDFSANDSERMIYVQNALAEIIPNYESDAVLFGGDFNDIPGSRMYNLLVRNLKDAWTVSGKGEGGTIPSDQPTTRIDYIFYRGEIESTSTQVIETTASDHRPVLSEFVFKNR